MYRVNVDTHSIGSQYSERGLALSSTARLRLLAKPLSADECRGCLRTKMLACRMFMRKIHEDSVSFSLAEKMHLNPYL